MNMRKLSFHFRRLCLSAMLLSISGCGDGGSQPAASNLMRWEKHDAVLNNAVAWQQEDVDKRWVTFVLLTDRPVPLGLLAETNVLDPARLNREDQVAEFLNQRFVFGEPHLAGVFENLNGFGITRFMNQNELFVGADDASVEGRAHDDFSGGIFVVGIGIDDHRDVAGSHAKRRLP